MKRKKLSSIVLAGTMMISLAACGGGNTESSGDGGTEAAANGGSGTEAVTNDEGGYDQVTYAYLTYNNIPAVEDLDTVEEKINEISREKIGVEVTLRPIALADYSSKVSLSLQGGEKLDIFQSYSDFNNYLASDMAMDITDLIDEYAPGAKEVVGEEWLKACTKDGRLYGIPGMRPVAGAPMLIYREDITNELEIDMSKVDSVEEVTEVFEQVKEGYPDMTPLTAMNPGDIGITSCFREVDFLNDNKTSPVGVLIGDSLEVQDLYSTDMFKELCLLAREWHENGLVMQDAATTTSSAMETMSSGNYFGDIGTFSYPEADVASFMEAQCSGLDFGAKFIGEPYLSTGDVNSISWMIASTSDVPEAALKFLDLTYTDADVINLLIFGIEGRDYIKNEDGTVSYPEGQDASTVPYTAQLSNGTLGNYFKMYRLAGKPEASLEWEMEQNQTAAISPAMGFTFDSSSVKSQYTAVQNVISQYLPGLTCGSLDPNIEIDKFVEALYNAGYQDIIAEKREQLNEWIEVNQ